MKLSKFVKTSIVALSLTIGLKSAMAAPNAPSEFTTKNYTGYESNVKIKTTWSPFPTPAGTVDSPTVKTVPWVGLRLLCGLANTTCSAELWMKTNTSEPLYIGNGELDVATGTITPSELRKDGFVITSPEPGVLEIREE